jgi:hypothetical protein
MRNSGGRTAHADTAENPNGADHPIDRLRFCRDGKSDFSPKRPVWRGWRGRSNKP